MRSERREPQREQDGRVDAVCVGETMALLVPDPPRPPDAAETFRREIGGAESNVAVHLARLGRRSAWHSAVGDDALGRFVRSRVEAEGVDCTQVRIEPSRPTGLYLKEIHEDATRVVYYRSGSAACGLGPGDATAVWARRPRVVHTSGITAVLSPSARALTTALLDERRPGVLRSFDVNYRPLLHGEAEAALLLDLARRADLVFCGVDEAQALWGADSPVQVADLLRGAGTVVVKQGASGATVYRDGRSWQCPAPEVTVVEPVGAGDAFAAGVLDGVLDELPMPDCLERGSRLAGVVLQVYGDLPPAGDARAAAGAAPPHP